MLKKNKRKVAQPLPYVSGTCDVFSTEKRTVKDFLGKFDYREETLGIKAFTEFQTIGIEVDKVISIPYNDLVDIGRVVKLDKEEGFYLVSLVQRKDTFPMSLRLTLSKTQIKWNEVDDD